MALKDYTYKEWELIKTGEIKITPEEQIEWDTFKAKADFAKVSHNENIEKINEKTYSIIECVMAWKDENPSLFIVYDITETEKKDSTNYVGSFNTYEEAEQDINNK